MPRPEKVQAVAEIKERFEGARAVFLAEYAGLSVKEQQALRRELRANDAEFKVVKMTLARRATDALDIEGLDDLLLGPTGLAFADGDPVGAAKALKDFSRDHDVFVVKGGLLGGDFLSPEKISELADIEPRDVLLAKIAGVMKAPMANMAGLLAALPRNMASVLQQLLEQKQADAPEEDATSDTVVAEPAEDAPADQATEPSGGDVPAVEDSADEAEAAPADETEDDDATATVEPSDDAADETENEEGAPSDDDATDEASDDDAEEK
jgi:large subunit ribosomal protein L10